jgi:hypothetical protein
MADPIFGELREEVSALRELVSSLQHELALSRKPHTCEAETTSSESCESSSEEEGSRGTSVLLESYPLYLLGAVCLAIVLKLARAVHAASRDRKQGGFLLPPSIAEILLYRLEYEWSINPLSIPLTLLVITLFVIVIGGVAMKLTSPEPDGTRLQHAVFSSWTFIADPAAHADLPSQQAAVGFVMTLLGMVIFGFLISIITDMVRTRTWTFCIF